MTLHARAEAPSAVRATSPPVGATAAPVPVRDGAGPTGRAALLRLQRTHGNRHVQRVVTAAAPLRTPAGSGPEGGSGPVVGPAGDRFEVEADRTADRVMRSIHPGGAGGPGHDCGAACSHGAAPEIGTGGGRAGASLGADLAATRGRGSALPPDVRSSMEGAFGSGFSGVRVHTDSPLAGRMAATAFTQGSDIHFAPGAFRPRERSGAWLLAHELTHVVQQGGGAAGAGPVRRHSSREHYILGSMPPATLKKLAEGKASAADRMGSVVADVTQKNNILKRGKKRTKAKAHERKDIVGDVNTDAPLDLALRALEEQIQGLDRWSRATMDDPDPARVIPGNTQFDHKWGGQLVTITCRDGEQLVCTVGDLNALPDFFGSIEDLGKVSRSIVFRTLQVIRRESLIYLYQLRSEVLGQTPDTNLGSEGWSGLKGNKVNVSNPYAPDLGNAVQDVLQTEEMLKGGEGEQGLPTAVGASATLGRNACHFPPESWLRWRQHHEQARDLVSGATTMAELGERANRAIALNAFGEHYLQDSFAGGHMINKGFVMAEAMPYLERATKALWGVDDAVVAEFQRATGHGDAYDLPAIAHARETGAPTTLPVADWGDAAITRPRDPQSALERARGPWNQSGLSPAEQLTESQRLFSQKTMRERHEVRGTGLDPDVVDFPLFRRWLNDFWLQKITNTLHDHFCVVGLRVASPMHPVVFRIYGDAHMMESAEGAEAAAEMSSISRGAINQLIDNKGAELLHRRGRRAPATAPVPSVQAVFRYFPDQVEHAGIVVPLKDWATGAPMREIIRRLLTPGSGGYNAITGLVSVASTAKSVSKGLTADHSPADAF